MLGEGRRSGGIIGKMKDGVAKCSMGLALTRAKEQLSKETHQV